MPLKVQGKIFISHCATNRRKEAVRKLADALKDEKYTVWVDTSAMTSSMHDEIAKQVNKQINIKSRSLSFTTPPPSQHHFQPIPLFSSLPTFCPKRSQTFT